jgi:ribonuclease BN (tRNA processing enzyme)
MSRIGIEFLGSGDAFGSGGRLEPCILVKAAHSVLLLDCGTTSLIAMKRRRIDPAAVDAIVLTHLHGDHFGGIPALLLDAQFSGRSRPLLIAGPPSTQARVEAAMEVLFPGSAHVPRRFPLAFAELDEGVTKRIGEVAVLPFPAVHASGAPSFIVRVTIDDKVITYSGDTEWTESLVEAADGADLLVCEAYGFDKKIKNHLDFETLLRQRDRLRCARLVLTHMSAELLARIDTVELECACDGTTVSL